MTKPVAELGFRVEEGSEIWNANSRCGGMQAFFPPDRDSEERCKLFQLSLGNAVSA